MNDRPAPIAIGGLGGSGTRVVASSLRATGYFMGKDLNGAEDNLWFTLLFKRPEILRLPQEELREWMRIFTDRLQGTLVIDGDLERRVLTLANTPRPQHSAGWLNARADTFLSGVGQSWARPWGWKEPNTHLLAGPFLEALPDLRYVHVTRNGLDMAYADNQKQAQLWGPILLGDPYEASPRYHLRYWRHATQAALELARRFDGRVLLVNYDRLCSDPRNGIESLFRFTGLEQVESQDLEMVVESISPPASAGRWRAQNIDDLDDCDVEFALSLDSARNQSP